VLDICVREGAKTYINLSGGQDLYGNSAFKTAGMNLQFIRTNAVPYPQRTPGFIPYLSIIDAMMELGAAGTSNMLDAYTIGVAEGSHA
jgi:hypothetical protein